MKKLGRWIWAVAPVVAYAAAIVYVSSRSSLPNVGANDKLLHFAEYAVLAFLVNRALIHLVRRWSVRTSSLVAIVAASFFGFTDEVHQYFVPNRDASVYDLIADVAGSTFGAMAYAAWADFRTRIAGRLPTS